MTTQKKFLSLLLMTILFLLPSLPAPSEETEIVVSVTQVGKTDSASSVAPAGKTDSATSAAPAGKTDSAASAAPAGKTDSASSVAPAGKTVSAAFLGEEALPKVINHIHFPNLFPDFAFSPDDDLLEIWYPSVRDQDAAIFFYQDQVWMLDCGDERAATETVPLLKHLGVKKIDRIINTHPHHDHLNGLYSIDAAVPVRELSICFPEDATNHMTAAMEYCKGNGIAISTFEDESILSMGDGLVSFLAWMKTAPEENMNDRSAQFMISYGACSLITMADMELRGQLQLYDALPPEAFKADILRYPHHGKRFMNEALYQAIDPALVIISNASRIPEIAESTKFLDYKHVPVAYTRRQNYILHLITDGSRWLCEEIDFDPTPYLPTPVPSGAGQNLVVLDGTAVSPAPAETAPAGNTPASEKANPAEATPAPAEEDLPFLVTQSE